MRYEATYGSNTKQWWLYDNETDEWVDPPMDVLKETDNHGSYDTADGMDEMRDYLEGIANDENPDWLYDEDYRYEGELDI